MRHGVRVEDFDRHPYISDVLQGDVVFQMLGRSDEHPPRPPLPGSAYNMDYLNQFSVLGLRFTVQCGTLQIRVEVVAELPRQVLLGVREQHVERVKGVKVGVERHDGFVEQVAPVVGVHEVVARP